MKGQVNHIQTEEDKFILRMNMSYEERFRAFMKALRFKAKLKNATIIKPIEDNEISLLRK